MTQDYQERLIQASMHSITCESTTSMLMFGSNPDRRQSTYEAKKEIHSHHDLFIPLIKRPMQKFLTGSRYIGSWNTLGFSGHGLYRYPHGESLQYLICFSKKIFKCLVK